MTETKVCTGPCGETKPLGQFDRDKSKNGGLTSRCRKCRNDELVAYRARMSARAVIITPLEKRCARCTATKAATEFTRARYLRDGLHHHCRSCRRFMRLLYTYGLTEDEYRAMYLAQGGCCDICDGHLDYETEVKVDHHHSTGRVRKLLCHGCNTGIGNFKENIQALIRAAEYLTEYQVAA